MDQSRHEGDGERLHKLVLCSRPTDKRQESFIAKESQGKSETRGRAGATDTSGHKQRGQGRIGELEDYVDAWVRCCFGKVQGHPGTLRRKRLKKRLGSFPRAATQRVRTWKDLEGSIELGQRQRLGQRQGRDGEPLGIKQKRIWGKKSPSSFAKQIDSVSTDWSKWDQKRTLVQDLRRAGKLSI